MLLLSGCVNSEPEVAVGLPVDESNLPVRDPGPKVSHIIAGREDCLACHGSFVVWENYEYHKGRINETCLVCHAPVMTLDIHADLSGDISADFEEYSHRPAWIIRSSGWRKEASKAITRPFWSRSCCGGRRALPARKELFLSRRKRERSSRAILRCSHHRLPGLGWRSFADSGLIRRIFPSRRTFIEFGFPGCTPRAKPHIHDFSGLVHTVSIGLFMQGME